MKRIATAAALAMFAVSLSFGDDAEVLPAGVARLRLIPSFTTLAQSYDDKGKADASQFDNTLSLMGFNGAFEFGVTDAVTLGLKWAPGYTFSSTFAKPSEDFNGHKIKNLQLTGAADLEMGGKIQVLGAKGIVASDILRVAVTPGLSIPLDKYDPVAEGKLYAEDKAYRGTSASAHQTLGFGAKVDVDYVISEMFYINAHGQALSYLPLKQVPFGVAAYHASVALATNEATADAMAPLDKVETKYGLEYLGEIEPHLTFPLGGDSSVGVGLPFTFVTNGPSTVDGEKQPSKTLPSQLSVGPWASFFTLIGPLPVEVQAQYALPLSGKNSDLLPTFSAQVRLFYKFY